MKYNRIILSNKHRIELNFSFVFFLLHLEKKMASQKFEIDRFKKNIEIIPCGPAPVPNQLEIAKKTVNLGENPRNLEVLVKFGKPIFYYSLKIDISIWTTSLLFYIAHILHVDTPSIN